MMGKNSLPLPAVLLSALLGQAVVAQTPAPSFRATVDVVPLHVSVTDPSGEPALGLAVSDFDVRDQGQLAELVAFAAPDTHAVIGLLIGDRPRMTRHRLAARNVAELLIESMAASDRLAISGYQHPLSPFTSNKEQLRQDLDVVLASVVGADVDDLWGWSAMAQLRENFRVPSSHVRWYTTAFPGRPVWSPGPAALVRGIVSLSSGMDHILPEVLQWRAGTSQVFQDIHHDLWTTGDRMVRELVRDGVVVYGIGFEGAGDDKRLRQVSRDSSGWFLEPKRTTDFAVEVRLIVNDLHARYLLGFVPVVFDGKDHKLEVRVKRPGVTVRARVYYQAPVK